MESKSQRKVSEEPIAALSLRKTQCLGTGHTELSRSRFHQHWLNMSFSPTYLFSLLSTLITSLEEPEILSSVGEAEEQKGSERKQRNPSVLSYCWAAEFEL